jgi:hypothetical protein
LQRACEAHDYALPGGAPRGATPLVPSNHGQPRPSLGTLEAPRSRVIRFNPKSRFFWMGGPTSLDGSGGAIPSMGCMCPQPSCYWRSQSYLGCQAIISDPQYPNYKTPTVVPEPSIERVARAGSLTDGRIGTQMILWGPPWDSGI